MDLIEFIDKSFSFEKNNIRVLGTFNDPLIVAKDICTILEIQNTKQVMKSMPTDFFTKQKVADAMGRQQETMLLKVAGLFWMVVRSKKPIARPFQLWICGDLLPSLYRTGSYKMDAEYIKLIEEKKRLEKENLIQQKVIKRQKYRIVEQGKNNLIMETMISDDFPDKEDRAAYIKSEMDDIKRIMKRQECR